MNFRQQISLDGAWHFAFDPANTTTPAALPADLQWRMAQVPLPWQAQFADLRHATGTAWYRRTVTVTERPAARAILHFNAADYHTTVWFNGQMVGEHEGGYLPFAFEVTTLLQEGENDLLVRVVDAGDDRASFPDYPFSEVPHGKQSWYGPVGGLWQSVWLEWCSAIHLRRLQLTPHPATGILAITTQLNSPAPDSSVKVRVQVTDPTGHIVGETTLDATQQGQLQLDPATLALWSPDSPALYTVQATVNHAGQPVDRLTATCGFRTVEARDGRIYLNGQPIYLRGVLDQAYYPETIYTPPSVEFLEDQVRKAKALGLNCLRCHIKIEDPRYYEVADRLGILIWTEIPNWALLTEESSRRSKESFRGMVARDWNHPSIFAWTLINEDWGTDLTRNAEHRRWLAEFYEEAKQVDPYRLIVDNSPCSPNFHVAGDIEDYHYYRAIPDHAAEWDQWVSDFANRASWVWAPDYTEHRRQDAPLIVSEFGNWGLPHPDQIQEHGRDPWWFETGHEWGEGIVYPHGMTERFTFWGLAETFGDFATFIRAAQEHMAHSLAYEISTMRLHSAIGGYVITEFTDVHWECNGLLDMGRNVKQGLATIFTPLNQDQVVVIRPQQWSGRPGEHIPIEIHAFGVAGRSTQGTIRWRAGAHQGELPAPGGVLDLPLSAVGAVEITAEWVSSAGTHLATNQVTVVCVAADVPATPLYVLGDAELAALLRQQGYQVREEASELPTDALIVAHHYTVALQNAVQQGAHLLLLAGPGFSQHEQSVRLPTGSVVARITTAWQGDWATAFSWLKKQGPFAALPGGPLLEMEYAEIMPDAVITGIPAWAYRQHSWAGLALGWIHKVVSLLVKVPYGRGTITTTTFNLTADTLSHNAVAQTLFAGLVMLAE